MLRKVFIPVRVGDDYRELYELFNDMNVAKFRQVEGALTLSGVTNWRRSAQSRASGISDIGKTGLVKLGIWKI